MGFIEYLTSLIPEVTKEQMTGMLPTEGFAGSGVYPPVPPENMKDILKARENLIGKAASYMPNVPLFLPGVEPQDRPTSQGLIKLLAEGIVPDPSFPQNPLPMEGALPLLIGALKPNYRSKEAIRATRKLMAEEQRARGALNEINHPVNLVNRIELFGYPEPHTGGFNLSEASLYPNPLKSADPIDQVLRGSWYHGMSDKARSKLAPELSTKELIAKHGSQYPELSLAYESSFPISRHDAQSISNRLGEPAGVSLSLNPTVSSEFSADDRIFRVMPLYGGPPTERTVNLMTQEGRNTLNDAYDTVANRKLMANLSDIRYYDALERSGALMGQVPYKPENVFFPLMGQTGKFNQQLSNQLQFQGYRHILYNPQRHYEYEMLALDPKYALPLDYRPVSHYLDLVDDYLAKRKLPAVDEGFGITPKAQNAIMQIDDIMAANHSRLGDIYAERPWWDRLSEPVKDTLLRDNPMADKIVKALKKK